MLHFIGPFLHLEASHTCQSSDKSHLLQFSWVYFLFPLQHFWAHQSVNHESLSQGELMSFYWTYNSHCQCSMYHFPPAHSVPEFVILGKRSQSFANLFHLAAGQQQLFWILEQWGQILTQSSKISPLLMEKKNLQSKFEPMDTSSFRLSPSPNWIMKGNIHVKWIYLYIQKWEIELFYLSASDEEGIPASPGGLGQPAVVVFNFLCFGIRFQFNPSIPCSHRKGSCCQALWTSPLLLKLCKMLKR